LKSGLAEDLPGTAPAGGFGLGRPLREKRQSRADAERRTLSQCIALILERYLEESGKPPRRSPARK
jgi:hypothetical protein